MLRACVWCMQRKKRKLRFLGPCVGETTPTSTKLWIHAPLLEGNPPIELTFTIHERRRDAPELDRKQVILSADTLGCGTATFTGLQPDTKYFYKILRRDGSSLVLPGITDDDLFVQTYPAEETPDQLGFMLISCHDPTQCEDDGFQGFRVWGALNQMRSDNDVRFALLAGDQIYGDHVQEKVLAEKSERERRKLYLGVYHKLWNHPLYRRALCSLPSYLMWDDHDITDGWGSRSDSFVDAKSSEFSPEWRALYGTARECFTHMQASRNPEPLLKGKNAPFDFCFKIGRTAFVMADLRSRRNSRIHQLWSDEQFEAVKAWVSHHRGEFDALFFVSPVVFTHGWPHIEKEIRKVSPVLTTITQALTHVPLLKHVRWVERLIKRNIEDVGSFRDDLEDAWASDPNNAQAEKVLDFLFGLQNPKDGSKAISVIILSGDIHCAGYSMLYSYKKEHDERPVIEHICSSPIASAPMHWMIEGLYQDHVKCVPVGTSDSYFGQVSHHHCFRNVVVLSLRRFGEELQLKAKYYLEGRPQPEIIVSDLRRVSRAEAIRWDGEAQQNEQAA